MHSTAPPRRRLMLGQARRHPLPATVQLFALASWVSCAPAPSAQDAAASVVTEAADSAPAAVVHDTAPSPADACKELAAAARAGEEWHYLALMSPGSSEALSVPGVKPAVIKYLTEMVCGAGSESGAQAVVATDSALGVRELRFVKIIASWKLDLSAFLTRYPVVAPGSPADAGAEATADADSASGASAEDDEAAGAADSATKKKESKKTAKKGRPAARPAPAKKKDRRK